MNEQSNRIIEEKKDINLFGKIAKFPKNTKAKNAYQFLENIKVNKKKLWYFIIEKENVSGNELSIIKYNNKCGVNLKLFVEQLKKFYMNDDVMMEHVNNLKIEGNDKFSIIRNIADVEIGDKKLLTILTGDLVRLLG